ncbi:MAG: hypothetical protein BRC26_03420 [Nanohaloarchaea archaeon QH_8_44_6]|nr:MAG: hypothetical protein BRC26_03420 [Nanohaloarchaea archaeon QH_8_44_6]
MAATDYIMGTLFAAVVAFLMFLSFSRGLSPVIVGAGILVSLVLWYLVNGADVESPSTSTSSADNRTTSNSSPSGGPDLNGPDLGSRNGGNNNGGSNNNGGGSSNDPVVNVEVETKTGQPPEEGIKSSDMIFEFDITDQSGSGLDMMEIKLDQHPPVDDDLGGQAKVKSATPFNMLFGAFGLRQGNHPYEVKVRDNQGNTTIFQDSFPVSNKNSGGQNISMSAGNVNWEKFHSEAQKEEQQFQKAIKELSQYKSDLDEEEETVRYLLKEAKDILQKIHGLDEELVKVESGHLSREKTESEIDQMKVELQEINKELKDFQAKLAHEVEVESNDEKLLNQIQELEQGLESEINYMTQQLNNL